MWIKISQDKSIFGHENLLHVPLKPKNTVSLDVDTQPVILRVSLVKQTGWKLIKDAEFFGNWVILQNRCIFCLSNTYVEKLL